MYGQEWNGVKSYPPLLTMKRKGQTEEYILFGLFIPVLLLRCCYLAMLSPLCYRRKRLKCS